MTVFYFMTVSQIDALYNINPLESQIVSIYHIVLTTISYARRMDKNVVEMDTYHTFQISKFPNTGDPMGLPF